MKKNFLRIAIMAVFALTLLAGSALADTSDCIIVNEIGCLVGMVEFGGMAKVYETANDDTISAMALKRYTTHDDALSMLKSDEPLGIFAPYMPPTDGSWEANTYIFDFPAMDGMWFKDAAGNWLTNIEMENVPLFEIPAGWESLGSTAGFEFYTTLITYHDNTDPNYILLNVDGWVLFGDEKYFAKYAISFTNVEPDLPDQWAWDIQVKVYEDDTPPVPEPGTLVLLGTGILGAAIVARKKIKK